jgi:hypothetical protein
MKCNINYKKRDNYTSPFAAWELVFKQIDCKNKVVWVPFYCDGDASKHLTKLGINHIHQDKDFFTTDVSFDYIIDNPPFSIKKKVIDRCLSLKKPFALLLPVETIERQYMRDKQYTVIIPKQRYSFKEGKCTAPFRCGWFLFGFGLNKQLIYE